ncbi:permease-like cell division protein FtsX [Nonomuraea sp. B10E15]|uniref:permease-like cell division protein FtsX n=1 Tax=Nonomuraea sp. B10E15 TaxID=3153560 RepID=UPI00325F055D
MNHSPTEDRLREALTEAGATLDPSTLRPLRAPERRFRLNHRLVTAAAAVVLAGTAAAVGLGGPGDVNHAVATNAEAVPIDQADMIIRLCTKKMCEGREATPAQIHAIEQAIWRQPEVEAVAFEGQVSAYERFRKEFANDQALLARIQPADMPPSFRLNLKDGAAPEQVGAALPKLPGVFSRVDVPAHRAFLDQMETELADGADVSVFLCGRGSSQPACGAKRTSSDGQDVEVVKEGRKVTEAQKTAIEKLIEDMPEVDSFVFEDQEAAYRSFRKQNDDEKMANAIKVEDMPESFRLKLVQETDAGSVVRTLQRQPGVASVNSRECALRNISILRIYGLSLPADVVCGAER